MANLVEFCSQVHAKLSSYNLATMTVDQREDFIDYEKEINGILDWLPRCTNQQMLESRKKRVNDILTQIDEMLNNESVNRKAAFNPIRAQPSAKRGRIPVRDSDISPDK